MRPDGTDADGLDDVEAVLPPPRELPLDPDDRLWHTAGFAAVRDEAPRRTLKLTAGMSALGVATLAVFVFAGVELAGVAGLAPPSPPRYVIDERANAQMGDHPEPGAVAPPLPAGPAPAPVAGARPPLSAPTVAGGSRGHDRGSDRSGKSDRSGRSDKADKSERRKHKSKSDD